MSSSPPRRFFQILDRRNLWDDTEEGEGSGGGSTKNNSSKKNRRKKPMDVEMIDLTCSPEKQPPPPSTLAMPFLPSDQQYEQQLPQQPLLPYLSRTLQNSNSRRHSILPAFPTSFFVDQRPLLLANVPSKKLNHEQLACRRPGVYPLGYTVRDQSFEIPSYFRSHDQSFMTSLIDQYKVDESILDYNLYRFWECFRQLANYFIRHHQVPVEQFELNDKEKKYCLEFYLQVDADCFYMKTCTFRGAKPRSTDEGLFCINEPDIRYGLSMCGYCPLCKPPYNRARPKQTMIRFGPDQTYRFFNGYQTILNCPADCQTQNLIYVLRCPCGQFEYIGETSQRLDDRLWYHGQHSNRIIHEFLIGQGNVERTRSDDKDQETLTKDRMLLYRHAARCPSAMQIFMNFNSIYWPFVPMTKDATDRQAQRDVEPQSVRIFDMDNPAAIGSKDQALIPETPDRRSDEQARSCIRGVPPLPPGYLFFIRQRIEQFLYFKYKSDTTTKPYDSVDLFDAAIIAVLPDDASEAVRRFVEALFITHTEAKLNTSGRLVHSDVGDNDDQNRRIPVNSSIEEQIVDRGEWCRGLAVQFFKY